MKINARVMGHSALTAVNVMMVVVAVVKMKVVIIENKIIIATYLDVFVLCPNI